MTQLSFGITLAEYNRRWDVIMAAYGEGRLTTQQAMDAVRELTRQIVIRSGRR